MRKRSNKGTEYLIKLKDSSYAVTFCFAATTHKCLVLSCLCVK